MLGKKSHQNCIYDALMHYFHTPPPPRPKKDFFYMTFINKMLGQMKRRFMSIHYMYTTPPLDLHKNGWYALCMYDALTRGNW